MRFRGGGGDGRGTGISGRDANTVEARTSTGADASASDGGGIEVALAGAEPCSEDFTAGRGVMIVVRSGRDRLRFVKIAATAGESVGCTSASETY